MRHRHLAQIGTITFTGILVLAFQNCGAPVSVGGSSTTSDPTGSVQTNLSSTESCSTVGCLDTTFGNQGIAKAAITHPVNDLVDINAAEEQVDGKIILAGRTFVSANMQNAFVARLNATGTLDTTFGTNGILHFNLANFDEEIIKIKIQGDGKILLLGKSFDSWTGFHGSVIRVTSAGALDSTFGGGDGIFLEDATMDLATVEPTDFVYNATDGSIFMLANYVLDSAGHKGSFIQKISSSGVGVWKAFFTLEPSLTDKSTRATGLILNAATSSLFVSGYSCKFDSNGDYIQVKSFITKYLLTGALDTSFGNAGLLETLHNGDPVIASLFPARTSGKFFVAGYANNSKVTFLKRFTSTGTLDTSFMGTGTFVFPNLSYIDIHPERSRELVDGKIVALHAANGYSNVMRFGVSGSFDTAFGGGDGAFRLYLGVSPWGHFLLPLASGKLLIFDSSGNIARLQ